MITDRDQRSVRTAGGCSLLAASLAVALVASPVAAQSETQTDAPRACAVFGVESGIAGVQSVRANCWGTGLILGDAEQFTSSVNFDLGATVVELVRGDHRRVLLLRALPDGQPIVEDLEMSLAVASGRSALSGIDDLSLDLTQFAANGVLEVEQAADIGQELPGPDIQTGGPGIADVPADGLAIEQAGTGVAAAVSPGQVDIGTLIATDPVTAAIEAVQ